MGKHPPPPPLPISSHLCIPSQDDPGMGEIQGNPGKLRQEGLLTHPKIIPGWGNTYYGNSVVHWYVSPSLDNPLVCFSGHKCTFPGCQSVIVIDGNMKNRRDICAATEAGFTEYEGLPGAIKTGCQLSPGYQSKYCYAHTPRISPRTPVADQDFDSTEEGVVRLITAKKQTRSETYYQVSIIDRWPWR